MLLVWYAATSVYVYSLKSEPVSADAAVVLGAAAWGNRPSPILRERINHAIELYRAGHVEHIIFTGGLGVKSPLTEAEVSRRYALGRGVPDSAIILEDKSADTIENLTNVREIALAHDIDTFIIVSTPMHMRRAMFIANRLGLDAYTSPTQTTRWLPNGTRPYLYVREVMANVHHWVLWPLIQP